MKLSQKTRDILARAQTLRENRVRCSAAMEQRTNARDYRFAYIEKVRKTIYYRQLKAICQAFEAKGIQFVVLKGFRLLDQLYDRAPERLSGDIDILVRFCDLQKACITLIENGYVNEEWGTNLSEGLATDSHLLMGMNHLREFIANNKSDGLSLASYFRLELHYAIASTYPVDIGDDCDRYSLNQLEVFSDTRHQYKEDFEFEVLDYDHEFLALLYHFSIHAMHGFRKVLRTDAEICDISYLLTEIALYWTHNGDDINIDYIWDEAIDCNRGYAVYMPLHIVNTAFNLNIPMRSYHEVNRAANGQDTVRMNVEQLANMSPHIWFASEKLKCEFVNHIRDKIVDKDRQKQFAEIYLNCQTSIHINRLKGLRYDQCISDLCKETCKVLYKGNSEIEITLFNEDVSDVESEYSEIKEETRKDIGKPGIYIMCTSKRMQSEKHFPLIWGYNIYKEHNHWHVISTNHGGEGVEYTASRKGNELHFEISDDMFENVIDLHMAAYKSAFQPYYHIIG